MARLSACVLSLLVLGACRDRAAPPEPVTSTSTASAPASASASASASAAASGIPPATSEGGAPRDGGGDAAPSVAQVVTRGARVILVEGGNVVARRPKGQATPLVLGPAPRDSGAKLSATIGPFLGQTGLLDVAFVESTERGWHHESRETHYVLDTSGADDAVACVFTGATRSGGEYASTSTSVTIKKTAPKPLAFDVVQTTTSRATQPGGRSTEPQTTTQIDHRELGAASCANRTPSP